MLHFEYGLQPYVRRVRVSDVASVPVEIFACFGGTVINTAVDGLRGHSSFKAKTNAFGTLFAFTYDHDQWQRPRALTLTLTLNPTLSLTLTPTPTPTPTLPLPLPPTRHGHAVAVGSVNTVITHSKASDRGQP